MRMRRATRAAVALAALAAGCATAPARPSQPASDEAASGWQALADGRRSDAEALFDRRLRAVPGDAVALFGRASIDFEAGRSAAAMDGYAATLSALEHDPGAAAQIAPVAAVRLYTLFDEMGPNARAQFVARTAPVELARNPALPWLARVELLRLASHAAREVGDANALAQIARTAGCVTTAADVGVIGPLASTDLDAPAPPSARAPRNWRQVSASGCRLDLPSTPDGRGGARLIRMSFDVPAGRYDVVVDYAGEGRLSIDGGAPTPHGSATRPAAVVPGPRATVGALDGGPGHGHVHARR